MALSAVSSATFTLGSLLAEEANYLLGVKGEIQRLETEMSWMQCFLSVQDVDMRQDTDKRIQKWVAEIRQLAYDTEDVVESFALKIKSVRKGGFLNDVKRRVFILKELWLRHQTRSRIEEIQTRIADLTRRLQTYGIKELTNVNRTGASRVRDLTDVHRYSGSNLRRELWQFYSYIDEDHMVGRTEEMEKVIKLVTGDCLCRVVSICAVGGIGKTPLAKKVYNDSYVRNKFTHFAWVYVSRQFQRGEVWKQVLSNFGIMTDQALEKKGDLEVAAELLDFLKANKCFVILDDVWSLQDWTLISPAFPVNKSHSKILLTSRDKEVAKYANDGRTCCIYEPTVLNEDSSWELFQKIAFQKIEHSPELKASGRRMLKHCEGLRVLIIVLGGTLSKCSPQEWQKVEEYLNKYPRIEDVITLSYEKLPSYLRPCFLCLSHFSKDYEIPVDRLTQLWIAEGFISLEFDEEDGEDFLEDVAEGYLVELVQRSIIQVGETDASLKMKTCRMHNLMRDLCLLKAKEENFLNVISSSSNKKLSSHAIRRIAVAQGFPVESVKGCKKLRSIVFSNDKYEGAIEFKSIFNTSKLIRVIDFEEWNGPVKLPSDLGKLIHLRFLSFKGLKTTGNYPVTGLKTSDNYLELPSSLGNLISLRTLDLRVKDQDQDHAVYVPNVLWRLEQLKHLYLPRWRRFRKCLYFQWYCKQEKLALHTLTKLRTLVNFNTEFCSAADLSQLISLRKLEITIEKDFNKGQDGNPPVIKSKYFQSLSISLEGDRIIDPNHPVLFLSSCSNLLSLEGGKIAKLPHFSPDVAEIILEKCQLEEDPMPTLESLPNLRILVIGERAFTGKKMVCSAYGFPKLLSLTIKLLDQLEEWKVDEGAMCALRNLSIDNCPKLKKIPDELSCIKTLQELMIKQMPKEFKVEVEPKFKHVSSIFEQIYEHPQIKQFLERDSKLSISSLRVFSLFWRAFSLTGRKGASVLTTVH